MRKQTLFTLLSLLLGFVIIMFSLRGLSNSRAFAYDGVIDGKTAVVDMYTAPSSLARTPTPVPCEVQFEAAPVGGNQFVLLTGEVGVIVELWDATTNSPLGVDIFSSHPDHVCAGFVEFKDSNGIGLLAPLIAGHILVAEGDNGTFDAIIVMNPTPSPTLTPTVTPTPSNVDYLPIISR